MTISSIEIKERYQGLGFGSMLLEFAIGHATSLGCSVIKAEDMSDNYRKPHNIYIKHGFEYDELNPPEVFFELLER